METPQVGDRVRVVTRQQGSDDVKSGLYYNYFGGLVGAVRKVYSPQEVAVDVEHSSLTTEMRRRHEDIRKQMKTKWLDSLSEESRGKLTERERDFRLAYVILVAQSDLEAAPAAAPAAAAPPEPVPEAPEPVEASRRPTSEELARAEEEELRRHQAN